jgi:hypothetical protein
MSRALRKRRRRAQGSLLCGTLLLFCLFAAGCAARTVENAEVTGYCGCGACSGWERGSWKYLKLDFWNRYVSVGPRQGAPYSGRTASGTKPRQPHPGLVSIDSLFHPWMIPIRLLFPWLWLPHDGSIAADTDFYRFGTRMHVPGYGYGTVEDRGSAIKGPRRLDLYFESHDDALQWGRQVLDVRIVD